MAKADEEPHLQLIEAQQKINNRFINVKRIDPNGGNGYHSLVFTAYDEITKENVILKFYHPLKMSDNDRFSRFHREGEILKILKGQPNILECIDGLCTLPITLNYSGIPINYEYHYIPTKQGIASIEQLIYSSTLTPERCLIFFREMCKSVARIHSRRICHRDLKPDNFFLFPRNDIRLGDFGTAKFFDGSMPDIRITYSIPVGHMQYISPENICQIGIADDYTYGADIFSLGAILFEMFTQQVLTSHLYNAQIVGDLLTIQHAIASMSAKDRINIYMNTIDSIKSSSVGPDIFSFNDFVPKSICYFLNSLYKSMIEFNCDKRLKDFSSIYRKLNICILILRNEKKYKMRIRQNKFLKFSK